MEQRYMKIFKPYKDEVKDISIDALKAQLKGVIILTLSAEVADNDKDLGGHHYVLSPARACDYAGSSGLKIAPDTSNDDDLRRERVALLEKILLDIASFVRDERLRRIEKNKKNQQDTVHLDSPPRSQHQVNLEELVVAVTDIAVEDEKVKEEKKKEETEEENTTDEQGAKEEEEDDEKDEEMKTEKEEENEEKTKEDGEKKLEEEEDKNKKQVDEEVVVENIEEEKKSSSEEEKKNKKKDVEEEEKNMKKKKWI
ncbi:hypothetical protein P3S68_011735 [Capsicum galapagoense]